MFGGSGDLTRGPLAGRLFRFGLPYALAGALHGLFNAVDVVIVGQVRPGSVAAVSLASVVNMIPMLIFTGIGNVVVSLVAHAAGARREGTVRSVAWESLGLTLVLGLVAGVAFYLPAGPLIALFETDAVTRRDGTAFLEIMSLGSVTMFLIMQVTAVLRGLGRSIWPVAILVLANALNLLLDLVLVFGWWGFPRLEVAGAAWATVISRGVGGLVGLAVLIRVVHGLSLRDLRLLFRMRYVKVMLRVGIWSSTQLVLRVLGVFVLLKLAADVVLRDGGGGEAARDVLDGIGVCIRLEMIAVFMGLGFGMAATALVGQNIGARKPSRAARGSWLLVLYASATMGILGIVFLLWHRMLFGLASPRITPLAVESGVTYLRYMVPAWFVMAVNIVLSNALNGAASTKVPLVIDAVAYVLIQLPLAYVLSHTELGLGGVWLAVLVAHTTASALTILAFRRDYWRASASAFTPRTTGVETLAAPPAEPEAPGGGAAAGPP